MHSPYARTDPTVNKKKPRPAGRFISAVLGRGQVVSLEDAGIYATGLPSRQANCAPYEPLNFGSGFFRSGTHERAGGHAAGPVLEERAVRRVRGHSDQIRPADFRLDITAQGARILVRGLAWKRRDVIGPADRTGRNGPLGFTLEQLAPRVQCARGGRCGLSGHLAESVLVGF